MEPPPPREWGHLKDSAGFWIQAGGIVTTFGGVIVGGAASGGLQWAVWVGLGIALTGVGIMLWALVLRLAHRHALGHMCPDPRAHEGETTAPADRVSISTEEYKKLILGSNESSESSD